LFAWDDCLAQVAIDFGGRNWLVWDTEFKREIGKMPTEMFCISLNPSQMVNIKAEDKTNITRLKRF
jgi:imidazoleglycerol-phosphate dehydratase/histidinol-phosphatase